uniref:Uncharacterized protein n=1 Tax=Lepeophtheirus salmonis TaxID=72036 RepID=A0A0K2TK61_LEPSM
MIYLQHKRTIINWYTFLRFLKFRIHKRVWIPTILLLYFCNILFIEPSKKFILIGRVDMG